MACCRNPFILSLWNFFLLIIATTTRADLDWYIQNNLNHGGDLYLDRISEIESNDEARNKDITATPKIFNGKLYYPLNGYLYAVNPIGGTVIWEKNLKELTRLSPTGLVENYDNFTVSVVTPEIACGLLIVGIYGPAVVIAVNVSTGELVWSTQLSSHVASVIAMSGIVHQGAFYVGTSSLEERLGSKKCCTFRGSLAKLDASTGTILWQTYTLPKTGTQSGASLWGSGPAIDESRKHIYIATWKSYSATSPQQQEYKNRTAHKCVGHSNSVLAVDLCTGEIVWSNRLFGCGDGFLECSDASGSSANDLNSGDDFVNEVPIMLSVRQVNETTESDVVVVTHKKGHSWTLERDDGNLVGFRKPVDIKAWLALNGVP